MSTYVLLPTPPRGVSVVPHDAVLGMPRAIFSHGLAGWVVDKKCPPFATSRDSPQ
jgi:hypothetical protein